MPTKPHDEDQQTLYSQPWWHGTKSGMNMMSSFGEMNGVIKVGAQIQSNSDDGVAEDTDSSTAPQSGLKVDNGQEQQQFKPVETSSPMELVGHSIVVTSYPYQDQHYAGMMIHGTQAHQYLLGSHQNRMPLPLQMEEEPVYVNAKQYHGILRRRQSRAKAELEKKVIRSRKPYLHESRHQHAMKRARGCGGRFLNTKKLSSDTNTNSTQLKDSNSGVTTSKQSFKLSGLDHMSSDTGNSSVFQDMLKRNTHSSGNTNLSSTCNLHLMTREEVVLNFKREKTKFGESFRY